MEKQFYIIALTDLKFEVWDAQRLVRMAIFRTENGRSGKVDAQKLCDELNGDKLDEERAFYLSSPSRLY